MPIKLSCSKCEKKFAVKDELVGRRIKCPDCAQSLAVPKETCANEEAHGAFRLLLVIRAMRAATSGGAPGQVATVCNYKVLLRPSLLFGKVDPGRKEVDEDRDSFDEGLLADCSVLAGIQRPKMDRALLAPDVRAAQALKMLERAKKILLPDGVLDLLLAVAAGPKENEELRACCLWVLGELGRIDKKSEIACLKPRKDLNDPLAFYVPRQIKQDAKPKVVQALLKLISDPVTRVAHAAILALSYIDEKELQKAKDLPPAAKQVLAEAARTGKDLLDALSALGSRLSASTPQMPSGKPAEAPFAKPGAADRIHFPCPECGKGVNAPPAAAGKEVRCPACKKPISVPGKTQPNVAPAAETVKASADIIGAKIAELADRAQKEGWNPFATILVKCPACGATYDLWKPFGKFELHCLDGGACISLDKAAPCQKCQGQHLTIHLNKKTSRDWLKELCAKLEACADDPKEGFQDAERGGMVSDHSFRCAGAFDQLWAAIGGMVNATGFINAAATFNTIWSSASSAHRVVRTTSEIVHYNEGSRQRVDIIKDRHGRLWFMVQR